jgi:aminoglycoside phosphotransferase (APT) family kinase protein
MERDGVTAAKRHVADVIDEAADHVTSVDRFPRGNRHAVYKVAYLDPAGVSRAIVVRVSFDSSPPELAVAEREARVLDALGGVAAPVLYDYRPTSPWFDTPTMCMEFVDGRPTEPSAASLPQIARLGSVVARVHQRPLGDLVALAEASPDMASYAGARLHRILETRAWARDPLPADARDRLARAADAVEASATVWRDSESFRADEGLALLHGDIAAGNVLWTPDPVLIDWEYARVGDPADEIAYTFDQNELTEDQRRRFWTGYRHGLGDQARVAHIADRVTWWEPVTLLGSTLWWVERWVRRTEADATGAVDPAVGQEPAYYFGQVMNRLDRLSRLVARMLRR